MIADSMKAPEAGMDSASLVVLCDCSGSMTGAPIRRLREQLTEALEGVKGARIAFFSTGAKWVDGPESLPDPDGSTNLTAGLKLALSVWPGTCLVISDGLPDDQESALEVAAEFPGEVSTIFCGNDESERDRRGLEFLRRLARVGGGCFAHRNLHGGLSITGSVRAMLAIEGPKTITVS